MHILTHPVHMGNQQRIYRECLYMRQRGWEVDCLYLGKNVDDDLFLTRDFFGKEHFFQYWTESLSIKAQIKQKIRNYIEESGVYRFYSLKYDADEWYLSGLAKKIRYLYEQKKYDVFWFQYMFFSKSLEELEDLPVLKIIDTHDKWANRNRIFQRNGQIPEYYYTTLWGERKALCRADLVIAIQENEARYFERLLKNTDTQVLTIGDLVERRPVSECSTDRYGFIGAKNRPNILGLEWFCNKVLPIVREREPGSQFIIAGAVCDCIPDYDGMCKIGRVDCLEDFYDNIKVAVNPIQNGTGLNIKTIEALAFGRPLITTSVGAKGIRSEKEVLLKTDSPQDFAEKLLDLLKNEERRNFLVENANDYIIEYNKKNMGTLYRVEGLLSDRQIKVM